LKVKIQEKLTYIGKSENRPDAKDKVTGDTKYITEMSVENMLYAAPVYSTIPYGKILSINTSATEKIPKFKGFFSDKDIPGENQVGVIFQDQPLFADPIVRYIGDSIGLIVAETEEAAHKAANLVEIKYEKYDPIFTIDDSKTATKNFLHKTNLFCNHKVRKGNIEEGFKSAEQIIEATFRTPFQEHYYLEPQGCIVIPNAPGVKVLGSLQCPFYIQKAVASVLGIELAQVIVEQAPTGGAFGGKEDVPSELAARAAVAAIKLQQPIKMIYSRRDDIQLTSKRHPFQMHYKVGVKNSGKLVAAKILLEENAGAYGTLSSVVSYRAAMQAMGPYVFPNIEVDSNAYYTNLPPTGAFRGFGSPQAAFGHERMMDIIATRLSIDPVELRLKNIFEPGCSTSTGQKLTTSVGAKKTIKRTAEKAEWTAFVKSNNDKFYNGIGIGTIHYGNCLGAAGWHLDGSEVRIQIYPNGNVKVNYGLVEMGQGAFTVVRQMTAEALGISIDRIKVLDTSTEFVRDSGPSVASRNVVMTGNAIRAAAEKLIPVLQSAAAKMLNCRQDLIKIENDVAGNLDTGDKIIFKDVVKYLFASNTSTLPNPLTQKGWWHVPKLEYDADTGIGEAYFTYSYATHIAQVRVNKLTGQVYVDKIWAAHDVGQAINPAGIQGQVEGGVAQGIGYALTENFVVSNGLVESDNLATYLLPTALDICDVETIIIEDPEPLGPWGAKGVGEPAIIPTAVAITNAVSNAIGKPINEIPILPETILDLI